MLAFAQQQVHLIKDNSVRREAPQGIAKTIAYLRTVSYADVRQGLRIPSEKSWQNITVLASDGRLPVRSGDPFDLLLRNMLATYGITEVRRQLMTG